MGVENRHRLSQHFSKAKSGICKKISVGCPLQDSLFIYIYIFKNDDEQDKEEIREDFLDSLFLDPHAETSLCCPFFFLLLVHS